MPDLVFLCPCKCLFQRYVAEGQKIEEACRLCGAVVDNALHTLADGNVVEVSGVFHSAPSAPRQSHLRLPGDQYDYISPIDGTHISSKRAHRDHLKKHNVVELGNEKPKLGKFKVQYPRESVRAELRNQLERMKSHGTWRER